MLRLPLPAASPELLRALAQGDVPRLVLVSDEAGVRWARPEEAPADAPPFVVTSDAIAALRSAVADGRNVGCAAVYEGGAYVVKAVEVATDGTAQRRTPPHGGHTTSATMEIPPHGGHTGSK